MLTQISGRAAGPRRACAAVGSLAIVAGLVFLPSAVRADDDDVKPTSKPLLWVIEGPTPSYVYGTIHLPDDRVITLPDVVEKALAASDAVYTEIPMDGMTQMKAASRVMLPPDKSLSDILPKKLYERTEAYLQKKGLPIQAFQQVKVVMVATQLPLLDYLQELQTKPVLDQMIYKMGQEANKMTGGIETVDEQFDALESLTEKEQVKLLERTLDLLEESAAEGESVTEKMIVAYYGGNVKKLMDVMNAYLDMDNPVDRKLFNKLIVERDERMAKRIVKMRRENPERSYFFAIGAGHLGTDKGVLAQLKEHGLKLRRLNAGDAVPK